MQMTETEISAHDAYCDNWNAYASDIFGVTLDSQQQEILYAIQTNKRVSVRSGNKRGKDYVAAVAAWCFLNLQKKNPQRTHVICTGPTQRQTIHIMMSEISAIYRNAKVPLGGEVLANTVKIKKDWYLLAFKAADRAVEDWGGFHAPNLLMLVTEATGVEAESFEAIEGLLMGDNTKLVLIFNPIRTVGEAYQSTKSSIYKKFTLSSLTAPNVIANKEIYPGQVTRGAVDDYVQMWCEPIEKSEAKIEDNCFEWQLPDKDKRWYRPNDKFRVRVLGEFPKEGEDQLYPLSWIEEAVDRWYAVDGKGKGKLRLGVDVSGMGRDATGWAWRVGNVLESIKREYGKNDHMETVGKIKRYLKGNYGAEAIIDAIGEGAGVYSRCNEQGIKAVAFKSSNKAYDFTDAPLTDYSGQEIFFDMRAYVHWALRDAINPQYDINFALPPDEMLIEEMQEVTYKSRSNGAIWIESKDDIKKRLKRSPDSLDAVLQTFAVVEPKREYVREL